MRQGTTAGPVGSRATRIVPAFEVAGRPLVGLAERRPVGAVAARQERLGVEDHDPRPGARMERREDRRRERVEVVHGEVRLAARGTRPDAPGRRPGAVAVDAEHRLAQPAARLAQAHHLADPQEQPGDLLVAEDEVAARLDALVASVDVLAGRAALARIRVPAGRLAHRHRDAEHVPSRARCRHAAIARPPVRLTPPAVPKAVEQDAAARMFGARGTDHGAIRRAGHGPIVLAACAS
jgi:hypothetical protein